MTLFTVFHQFIRLLNGGAFEDEKQSFCHIIDLQFCHCFISICLFFLLYGLFSSLSFFLFLHATSLFLPFARTLAIYFITKKKIIHFGMSHFWMVHQFICVCVLYCIVKAIPRRLKQIYHNFVLFTFAYTIVYYTLNQLGFIYNLSEQQRAHLVSAKPMY